MKSIQPVFFGSDINGYSMARSYFEEYKQKAIVFGSQEIPVSSNSNILQLRINPDLHKPDVFLQICKELASEFKQNGTVGLLVGCHDIYVRHIAEHYEQLKNDFYISQVDVGVLDKFILKENLYALCEKYQIDYPKMISSPINIAKEQLAKLALPVIIKPSDTVEYSKLHFTQKRKVYIAYTLAEAQNALTNMQKGGYAGNVIVQEYIVGEDDCKYTLSVYSDRNAKVQYMSLARHILEECVPTAFGMPTALMVTKESATFYNQCQEKYTKILESEGYTGHSNFDVIYDERDNKFKLLEINTRQGRSNYYVTMTGHNAMKLIIDDVVHKTDLQFSKAQEPLIWSVVPSGVISRYVENVELKKEVQELLKSGKIDNPMTCKYEKSIWRKVYHTFNQYNYYIKYYRYFKNHSY